MALDDLLLAEAGAPELAVDVAGEHKRALRQGTRQVEQDAEAGVRDGAAVQGQAVAIETPGQGRVGAEAGGVGDLVEGRARRAEGRVGFPETGVAAKVGQAGVDAHAGAGANEQGVGAGNQGGGAGDVLLRHVRPRSPAG